MTKNRLILNPRRLKNLKLFLSFCYYNFKNRVTCLKETFSEKNLGLTNKLLNIQFSVIFAVSVYSVVQTLTAKGITKFKRVVCFQLSNRVSFWSVVLK